MRENKKPKTQKAKSTDTMATDFVDNSITSNQNVNYNHNTKKESQGQNTKR